MVQWLRLGAFTAVGPGSIPGQGASIPQAEWCGQKKKKDHVNCVYQHGEKFMVESLVKITS